jgi:hypothetical protein
MLESSCQHFILLGLLAPSRPLGSKVPWQDPEGEGFDAMRLMASLARYFY